MDELATPNGTKRGHPKSDDDAQRPSHLKKRRLEPVHGAESPSTPKALSAITSALGGIFGSKRQPATNGECAPTAPTPPRPAIKLAALRGTKWDPDGGKSPLPKKTPTPKRGSTPRPTAEASRELQGTQWQSSPLKERINPADQYELEYGAFDESPSGPRLSAKRPLSLNGTHRAVNGSLEWRAVDESPSKRKIATANKTTTASAAPKGIMTPAKKPGPRPQKIVTFGSVTGGEVFFEDLPKKPPPGRKRGRPRKKKEEAADDEIVCALCSRPDSEGTNQIILCDNCDFAVHQECYEVPEIPDGDWLCKSCAQEEAVRQGTPSKSAGASPAQEAPQDAAREVPDIPNLDVHVRALQRVLLDRCAGRRRIKMIGQEEALEKVRQLVEQTVLAGEGNSMLLIGARGCGKTTLVESVISELSKEHRRDFHVVRLNGFLHTDDKLALKETWRQLGKEMAVEDDLLSRSNYADTMASLLALLSHPSEITGADRGVTSQSVLFVIDEFDMFAAHPRQTLLYNLFDIAQSRKAPVAVLGCTARLDVVEMLEKRVKSRFSHRYAYLALPRTLPAYWQVCRQGLMVDEADAEGEGLPTGLAGHNEFRQFWSHKMEGLYKQRPFQDLLQHHYYTTKSVSAFWTEWMVPLSCLSATKLSLQPPTAGSDATSLAAPDSRQQLLAALSDLDLNLLIAAARLDVVAHADTVNFAMAYDEYSSLVGRQRVQSSTSSMLAVGGAARVWGRGVAGIAWERLVSLGLLVPAGTGVARTTLAHGGLEGKMWKMDVALEEIPAAVKLNQVQARWCREI